MFKKYDFRNRNPVSASDITHTHTHTHLVVGQDMEAEALQVVERALPMAITEQNMIEMCVCVHVCVCA